MDDKRIPTYLGTVILVIIAITVGTFVWVYEKNQQDIAIQPPIPKGNQQKQAPITPEKYPAIPEQPDMSLEDIIRQAIYKKVPDWKIRNYDITVTVETDKENHAIGRFIYDGYSVVNDGRHHDTGEGIWFAAESNANWILTGISYVGYWGSCQDFQKYGFPTDMTPDCWDTEKNILVDTAKPQRFYHNGFTKDDKKKLIQAFNSYLEEVSDSGGYVPESYLHNNLYVRFDKLADNFLVGTILIGGSQNISAPYFLATKQNSKWIVVYNGQDIPPCSAIKSYNFPHNIVGECYDEQSKRENENI